MDLAKLIKMRFSLYIRVQIPLFVVDTKVEYRLQ